MAAPVSRWPFRPPGTAGVGARGKPRIVTAVDLSHVAPAPRLAAEERGFVMGLLVGLPLSLCLWALLWVIA